MRLNLNKNSITFSTKSYLFLFCFFPSFLFFPFCIATYRTVLRTVLYWYCTVISNYARHYEFNCKNTSVATNLLIILLLTCISETQLAIDSSMIWVKANVHSMGFYVVNYDELTWKALARQLYEDHTVSGWKYFFSVVHL